MCLGKFLEIPVSGDTSTSNMVNATKHCRNLNDTIFTIFIDQSEANWVQKRL